MGTTSQKVDLNDLFSDNPKIKYGCSKKLLITAKDNPSELYPHIDFFTKLLNHENKILKWTAIDVIGLLSKIDKEKKVDNLLNKLIKLLNAGNMITANHVIHALTNIVLSKPEYEQMITKELLKVEYYNYDTEECRNIALGKVILSMRSYLDKLKDKEKVIEFVERQTKNSRNATKKKAEQLLSKIKKSQR